MKTQEMMSSTWEDLVFENRNKAYGAFAIRKSYSKSISEAVLASTLLVSMVLLGPRLISFMMGEKSTLPIFNKEELFRLTTAPRLVPVVEPLKAATSPSRKSKMNLVPLVTTESVQDTPPTPPTDDVSSGETRTNAIVVEGTTVTPGVETVAVSVPPAIVDWAEVMPTYEGGLKAMMKYIQKNLKYPNRAAHLGIEGKVFIKFVVNYEGKVVNVEIVKGIFEDCDKEAARVIAMMPDWKPGIQNNTPVSVRMILPINFKLEN
jgi:protein TonB